MAVIVHYLNMTRLVLVAKSKNSGWPWCHLPLIPALRRGDFCEFKDNMVYLVSLYSEALSLEKRTIRAKSRNLSMNRAFQCTAFCQHLYPKNLRSTAGGIFGVCYNVLATRLYCIL